MLRATLALAASFLAVPLLAAPAEPPPGDGDALLRRVADTYSRADRFYLSGDIQASLSSGAGKEASTATFVAASGGKGRLRDELDSKGSGMIRVSDGMRSWLYVGQLGQYTESAQALPTPDTMDSVQVRQLGGIVGALLNSYRNIAQGADSVKVLRAEVLKVRGVPRSCDVVRARYASASGDMTMVRTYWIERQRAVVWKQQTVLRSSQDQTTRTETLAFRRVTINQPVADSVFVFRPPKGAKKVAQLSQPGAQESDLIGTMAADFALTDLEGKTHRLADHRGKVVMLDFWATWCGPCRIQMPSVDRLYNEFKDKGLVVYAVNQRESADRARAYLQKNSYSTTALLDSQGDVGRQYQVNGIPTLVIVDREGKIVAHWVGVRPEDTLREGLKRAGIQ